MNPLYPRDIEDVDILSPENIHLWNQKYYIRDLFNVTKDPSVYDKQFALMGLEKIDIGINYTQKYAFKPPQMVRLLSLLHIFCLPPLSPYSPLSMPLFHTH